MVISTSKGNLAINTIFFSVVVALFPHLHSEIGQYGIWSVWIIQTDEATF